ncbi:MAG: O-antigen ligase family protein [Salinivirgaceae bacterium]
MSKQFISPIIILFSITWLFNLKQIEWDILKNRNRTISWLLLLPTIYFIINIISALVSNNKHYALFDLEVKLSLLLFPLIVLSSSELIYRFRLYFLKVFLLGNLVALIIDLIVATINSIHFHEGSFQFLPAINEAFNNQSFFLLIGNRLSHFSYVKFSVFHHPAYFSMFLNLGVVISYYFFKTTIERKHKVFYLGLILIFYLGIYLLSTRSGLLALFTTLVALTVIEFSKKSNYVLVFLLSFSLNYGLYKAITVSKIKDNVKEIAELSTQNDSGPKSGKPVKYRDTRLNIWDASLKQIKQNFWFGVGNGDVKHALIQQYKSNNFLPGVQKRLNTHNQYLETQLSGGIISTLILLAMLILGLIHAFKENKLIFGFLICVVGFNFLFESMLNTMAGVIFFSFFYSFLIRFSPPKLSVVLNKFAKQP